MGWENNAKTQETGRRCQNSIASSQSERLGSFEESSRINGTQQNGLNYDDCSRKNILGQSPQRERSVGKILERLELIENAYLSYVKSHQQRLETRLEESKEQEEKFQKALLELKQEIYNLVSVQPEEES